MNTSRIEGPSFLQQSSTTDNIDHKVADRKEAPAHLSSRSLQFSYNKDLQQVVVQVMEGGVQVEQIPAKDTVNFLLSFRAEHGPLINKEI